jgi:hypothetical protein
MYPHPAQQLKTIIIANICWIFAPGRSPVYVISIVITVSLYSRDYYDAHFAQVET